MVPRLEIITFLSLYFVFIRPSRRTFYQAEDGGFGSFLGIVWRLWRIGSYLSAVSRGIKAGWVCLLLRSHAKEDFD